MGINSKWDDEECSVIGEKGEVGFIDYEDDASVCSYNPSEEGPVIISAPFRFEGGKPRSVFVGETVADSITIRNTTREPVELWATKIYASTPENSFTLSLMEPPSKDSDAKYIKSFVDFFTLEERVLQPGELLTVWLSCKPKEIGLHTSIVHFDLGENTLERVVFLLGEDKISQSLAANKPYARGAKKKNHFVVEAPVRGVAPSRTNTQRGYTRSRLPWYNIPKNVRELVEDKHIPDPVREGLTIDNYSSYFKHLLYMEEIHLEEDMRAYDMECVSMRRKGPLYLTLQVPGLAERRPSLVHGDHIFVKLAAEAADNTSPSYEGYIHRVEADEVYLRFAHDFHFHHRDTELYNVQFTYDRVNMRRMYQAVDAANKLEMEFLFPSSSAKIRLISTNPLVPISCNLNEEQILSLEMILGCNGGPPFVIYGPPGTGKTVTLVEAILQLYTTREDARIFVCASSNSAADHILEKLLCEKDVNIKEKEVFRLNAASRSLEDCNPDHIRFCFFEDFIFKCPPINALMRYRIIISTYMSASSLFAEGVHSGHFSHIFLDEAGQASEPETMIPISNLTQRDTVVVLAGDPKQLGPVIYSKDAESYGLGKSYLERLFEYEFYYTGNENYVTKLVRNYRSHPEILRLPSKLFYEGELIACKDDVLGSPMPSVKFLPNKEFPVLFVGIQGCDEREGSNPSWFNRIEASKVVEMIKKLIGSGNFNEEDIGVITPYRQQVLKIRTALERDEIADIKVGSVEQFQGQEKEVIIISSVRSTVKHNEFDKTFCLGFLSNPRRFNVAITRARSLLIIIGNPHIVSKDRYWNELLWHCSDNGSYQGCVLPDRQEYLDDYPTEQDGYNNEENSQLSNGAEWGQEFSQAEWGEKPVKGNWGQESSQAEWGEKPVEGNWGQESSQAESGKKPVEGNWGQESSQAEWSEKPVEGNWGQESSQAEWGEKPIEGNWGQESSQAEWGEKPVEGNWGQESSSAEWSEKPVKGGWAQESTQPEWSKKPLKGDWGQESYQTKKWSKKPAEGNWGEKSYQSEWSKKPVIGDWGQESYQAEWSERPVKGEWGQGSSEAEWNAKAVKDESQWDDGWK